MKIQTKLILAFLVVGTLPMLASVYLTINLNEKWLNLEAHNQLDNAINLVDKQYSSLTSRTAIPSTFLAEDKIIIKNVAQWNSAALIKRMQEYGETLKKTDKRVNDIELLSPQQLKDYVPDKKVLIEKANPVWQGYTITTTQTQTVGVMVSSIGVIRQQGKILGGVKVGAWVKDGMVDAIPGFIPNVQASLLEPPFKVNPKDPASQRMNTVVLDQKTTFRTERLLVSNVPFQVIVKPLKDKKDNVIGAIFLGIPRSTVGEVWSKYKYSFYGLMVGVSAIVAIILGLIIARSISKPVQELSKGVDEVSKGNLDYQIKIKSGDEIQNLAHSYNQMAFKLKEMRELEQQLNRQEKLASLGKLSAGVAHEIRNPLGSIKSYAAILRDRFLKGEKELSIIKIIIDEVNRLNDFIQEFLDFARPREPQIKEIDPLDVIHRTIQLAQTQFSSEKYHFEVPDSNPKGMIAADPNQLQQVLLNLVLNGCQAMSEGGTLKISFTDNVNNHMIGIAVKDQGAGISEDVIKKIFDPFFTTRDEGTGLGLSVANQIIENHHGRIKVDSVPGEGTTFTLYLPLADKFRSIS